MRKVDSWKPFGFVFKGFSIHFNFADVAGILIGFNSRGIAVATLSKFPINELLQIKMSLAVGSKTGILINLYFEGFNVTRVLVRVSSKLKSNVG